MLSVRIPHLKTPALPVLLVTVACNTDAKIDETAVTSAGEAAEACVAQGGTAIISYTSVTTFQGSAEGSYYEAEGAASGGGTSEQEMLVTCIQSDNSDPALVWQTNCDESALRQYFLDADADGFGFGEPALACSPPVIVTPNDRAMVFVSNDDDCDDASADINPDGHEICNGLDDDCDGLVDDADDVDVSGLLKWYCDRDQDGYGDPQRDFWPTCDGPPLPEDRPSDCEYVVQDPTDCDDYHDSIGQYIDGEGCGRYY